MMIRISVYSLILMHLCFDLFGVETDLYDFPVSIIYSEQSIVKNDIVMRKSITISENGIVRLEVVVYDKSPRLKLPFLISNDKFSEILVSQQIITNEMYKMVFSSDDIEDVLMCKSDAVKVEWVSVAFYNYKTPFELISLNNDNPILETSSVFILLHQFLDDMLMGRFCLDEKGNGGNG